MRKKMLILGVMPFFNVALWAQELHTELLFQYYGYNENHMEMKFISAILQEHNLTQAGPDQEKAILEAHNYYLNNKDEVDMLIKAKELIEYRAAVKGYKTAGWLSALSQVAAAIPDAVAAGQQRQTEYQEKLNRDKNIQNYIAQHSSNSPTTIPQQNFGTNSNPIESTTRRMPPRTSNGFDEPLPSAPSYSNNITKDASASTTDNSQASEKIISAVYVQGGQLISCRLRYNSGQIWGYSTSKNAVNRENWIDFYPQRPTSTMSLLDGDNAKDYKFKIKASGLTFYFNM